MAKQKFDETDRRKVIAEVESALKVALQPVGTRRKYLADENGRRYCILGGFEDWHGLPGDIVAHEEEESRDSVLVVAKRRGASIDIFYGPFALLVQNKAKLVRTRSGDYVFNVQVRSGSLFVKEVPNLILKRLGKTEYSQAEREQDVQKAEALSALRKLSPEERQQLFDAFINGSET